MTSLKETIETFTVAEFGHAAIYVEDVPGIVVSALQDLVDFARREANLSETPQRYRGLMDMAHAIESYQTQIATELM